MLHAACTYIFHGESWLLMDKSQIGTLILDFVFGHNLCFKYSNGSCEPILDIYVSRAFQWYKKLFNPMNFDRQIPIWIFFLKIWNSIGTLTPKVGVHLGVGEFIPSHSQERKCDSWVALLARTFPCLCFGCKPKAKVVTLMIIYFLVVMSQL
jgi:hypothetical protein